MKYLSYLCLLPILALVYLIGYTDGENEGEQITLRYNPSCQHRP